MGATGETVGVPLTRAAGWARTGLVVALVLALDQATKALVRGSISPGEESELLPFLSFVHVHNHGVAFGFLGGGGAPVLIVVGLALVLLIGYFGRHTQRPLLWLPTGLLLGGALGNLLDRIHQGYVTDFIHFPHWPAFNVADISITVGVIVLVLVLERNARADAA